MKSNLFYKIVFLIGTIMPIQLFGFALPQQIPVGVLESPYISIFFNNENGLPQNTVFDIEKDDF